MLSDRAKQEQRSARRFSSHVDAVVGQRLGECRVARGVSVDAMAATLGITVAEYAEVETGQRRLTAPQLMYAAKLLGVRMSTFFEEH